MTVFWQQSYGGGAESWIMRAIATKLLLELVLSVLVAAIPSKKCEY